MHSTKLTTNCSKNLNGFPLEIMPTSDIALVYFFFIFHLTLNVQKISHTIVKMHTHYSGHTVLSSSTAILTSEQENRLIIINNKNSCKK
jgi:hypothetical protein